MDDRLSDEFLLAAACCRWPDTAARDVAIRHAASRVDWDRVVPAVSRHRIAPLVHDGLRRAGVAVPESIALRLRESALDTVSRNLGHAAEMRILQRLFAAERIDVAVVKGLPLAVLAYGSMSLRDANDIDLVVDRDSLMQAMKLLETAGYVRFRPDPAAGPAVLGARLAHGHDISFVQPDRKVLVELHWQLFENPALMPGVAAVPPRRTVELTRGVAVGTLGPCDQFAYLCAHGAGHGWFRLKWLADIGALVAGKPDGTIERFHDGAVRRGVGRCAGQALLLCRRLLDLSLPLELERQIGRDRVLRRLEQVALAAMTADRIPTETAFGTTRLALTRSRLARGWRFRQHEIRLAFRSEGDMVALRLPGRLTFLYPVLRVPLWLWRRVAGVSRRPRPGGGAARPPRRSDP